jgi:predicted dehydrogenase
MSLKVALVGCGKIADGHIEEIQKSGEVARLVAVCDVEELMAEQLARRFDIPAHYSNFVQMLDRETPDVVHIATPPGHHLHLACTAIDAGCHVYVEKPLAPNLADAAKLLHYAETHSRKATVNYTYWFDPPALLMRDLIAKGELGDPIHAESVYGYNLAGPFGSALLADPNHWVHQLPGKLFQNNIDHMINKLVEFVPDDSPEVLARALVRRTLRFGDVRDEMEDELRVSLLGAKVTASGLFSSNARPVGHYCRVFGTKNTLTVDYVARTVTFDESPHLPSAIGRLLPAFASAWQFARAGTENVRRFVRSDFHFFAGLGELIRRFYACIETDAPPPIAYRDILRVAGIMDRIWQELANQRIAASVTQSAHGLARPA